MSGTIVPVGRAVLFSLAWALATAGCGSGTRAPRDGAATPEAGGQTEAGVDPNGSSDAAAGGDAVDGTMGGGDGGSPQGGTQGGTDGGADGAYGGELATRIPAAPLRRLTNFQYTNTVRDQLGLAVPSGALPAGGASEDPSTLDLGTLVDAYHRLAHDFAAGATSDATAVAATTGCDVAARGEAACAQQFIGAFVTRIFRRPLEADDTADFTEVFAQGRDLGGDFASGVRAVIEVALQAPEFLYRVEVGEPIDGSAATTTGGGRAGRPRPYEMASRLSYLLWGSAPDPDLLQAAAANQLMTRSQIEAQARRLLADDRAHAATKDFYTRLFSLDAVATSRFDLGTLLQGFATEEATRFVDDVVWSEGGDLRTLLTASFTFATPALAQIYGLANVGQGVMFSRVMLPATQRRGLLTEMSFLWSTSSPTVTHPSARGAFVANRLLCADIPEPPDGATHSSGNPPMQAGETRRAWLERLTADGACQTCHASIDGIGFSFEHYDPRGAWRDNDAGLAIDARVQLTTTDAAGSFDGALALIDRLAGSRDVLDCHARKWMEAGYGRKILPADACSREQIERSFASTGGNIRELLIALTQTEAFLYRAAP